MYADQRGVNQKGCDHRLKNTDNGCLLADLFELREAKLIADRKGDKAERHVGNDRKAMYVFAADEAKTLNANGTDQVRAKHNARNEIRGNGRQARQLCKTGEHQPCDKRKG